MAGVLVGSAVLSGFFNVLFDRAATREFLKFLLPDEVVNFEKLLWKLNGLLWSADVLMDDAEEKRIHDKRVEKWLTELKDVAFKAGEVVDKIETEALRLEKEGGQSKNLFSTHVKSELEEILSLLEFLLERKDEIGLQAAGRNRSSDVRTGLSVRPTPVADESDFCGREEIKETIMQSLRSAGVGGDKVSVIPVIGAGGLGKTTLVQMIYDHPQVKQLFGEVRAWVTVSTEFDLPTITKKIIRKVSSSSQINGDEDQQDLLFKLRDALKEKKFLLVLDDVWSENHDEWNNLKSCFKFGERGSKIIVTTRSSKVASIAAPNQPHHFLLELSREDCWRLFAKTVFTSDPDRDARPDLQEIGKKIVEKCKGNPLSVISVGGILGGDRDRQKWESILKSSVWELLQQKNKNIIPSLWLSYRYLPSEIKPCFAYCSIFPKDYSFEKEEVVRLWMAEGFLKNEAGQRGMTVEEVGKRYFEELISRSLFQRSKDSSGDTFIMHDLVHDLAMNVSEEFCVCLDGEKNLGDLSCKTRYLSCNMEIQDVKKSEGLSKAKRLHSFVRLGRLTQIGDILEVLEELAMEGGCLRVLSLSSANTMKSLPDSIVNLMHLRYLNLSETGIEELPPSVGTLYNLQTLLLSDCENLTQLPDSIGNLKHLSYLNLSWTGVKKLPNSIGTLYNLQTLLLSNCEYLTQLPSNMGSLINLRHLDTRGSPLEEMPPQMCNLTKLQTLTDFVVGKHGSSIRDLRALHDLNGELRISGLQNVDDILRGNLENKENLSQLVLEWEGQIDDSREAKTILDALQPHTNLKKLHISKYGGTGFSDWVGNSLFSKIERMHLDGCQHCLVLPSLGRLASLKELKMKGFHLLETIGDEFYGNDSPFKSLEVLRFSYMPEWMRWSVIEFPRLKELKLKGCPKLVGSLPNSNTITILDIYECESLDFPENHLYPSLERLTIVRSCGSIKRLSLEHLPKLNELELEELECLVELSGELPNELKRLSVEECPKLEFMGNGRYGLLKDLKIRKCEALKSIPLDYFPKLDLFTLKDCQNFESFTFVDEPPLVLESLYKLDLEGLPKFVSFPEGGLPAAPNLKEFYIKECKNLRSLPQQMHRLLPSLNMLEVINCPLLERRYRKETGEGWHKISRIPRVRINRREQHRR